MAGTRRDEAALRRRLRTMLDDLEIVPPLTPALLCERLARRRERPIELVEWALPPETVSGFLIVYEHKDVIVHQSRTSALHRQHIVFHEVAHLVLEHAGRCGDGPPVPPEDRSPGDGPATLYDEIEEWEAETAATILSSWTDAALIGLAPPPPDAAGPEAGASSRLGAALGLPSPWR